MRSRTCCRRARRAAGRAALLRGAVRQRQPARALAEAGREIPAPAPSRDAFIYEPVLVGSLRGCILRGGRQPGVQPSCLAAGFPSARATTRRCCAPSSTRWGARSTGGLGTLPGRRSSASAPSSTSICSPTAMPRSSPATRRPIACGVSSTRRGAARAASAHARGRAGALRRHRSSTT